MASTALTAIPTTQPSCGPISMAHWQPNCNSNSNNANSSEGPMGCFIQPSGFFCAPIATTRGFLYSLDSNAAGGNGTSSGNSTTPSYVPRLSIATNDNSTNPSPPLLGVDGQPVNYQGPARLGQTCLSIPLPPSTDPLFQTLVTVANHRLNTTVGYSPGLGAGLEVLSLRGDCEQGSFCDLSPATAVAGPGGSKIGVCREQLPNFHNCTSYMQCLSLRCDIPPQDPGSVITPPAYLPEPLTKRATVKDGNGVPVCMASNIEKGDNGSDPNGSGGGSGNGNGNGTTTGNIGGGKGGHLVSSKFPTWVGAILAMLVLLGAAVIIGLARRRKKLRDEREKKLKKNGRGAMGPRNRERTISFNEKTNGALSTPLNQGSDNQANSATTGMFSSLFAKGLKDPNKNGPSNVGARHNPNKRKSKSKSKRQSMVLSAVSSETKASSFVEDSIISMDERQGGDGYSEFEHSHFVDGTVAADVNLPSPTMTVRPSSVASASMHSDRRAEPSTSAPAPHSPSSRLSVSIPRITTTLTAPGPQDRFQDGESVVPPRHSFGGPPSFISTASDPTSLTSLAFSSSRSSSDRGLLTPVNGSATPPFSPSYPSSPSSTSPSSYMQLPHQQQPLSPGSPVSPISPISPRPPLSSGPSSRLSHRQSIQAPVHRS
ncbi:hypothetical protein EMPS_01773 [Entomortierella parvispora]|uniref:Uncharacterized protein n=1 Tax=Entomortierella parvispora TaxID=205924 RepID=A0A9P3LT42_9FUNG|nr:hypothetical protein EMPS_01773 [Entomortierella parvispora]